MASMRGGAFADSGIVQVDLVFPRNDTTYQPVYPFPIVFAVHNISLIWPYSFFIDWQLDDNADDALIDHAMFVRGADATIPPDESTIDSTTTTDVPEDQWLLIFSTPNLINSSYSELRLHTSFELKEGCNEDEWEESERAWPDKDNFREFHEVVTFRLDDSGEVPDIEEGDHCPLPIGAISVLEQLESDGNGECPLLGDSQEEPHPVQTCAASIDAAAASQVASQMLNDSSCTEGQWPDPTGLIGPCMEEDSGAGRSLVRLFPLLAVVFVIVAL